MLTTSEIESLQLHKLETSAYIQAMRRGDPKYVTPSGAFLDHLTLVAAQHDLVTFANECARYVMVYPEAATYVANRVPAKLHNWYFKDLPNFDYKKFIDWSCKVPQWGDELKENFTSPVTLQRAASKICHVVMDGE